MSFTSIIPVLRSFDYKVMSKFYLEYLGFKLNWEYRHTPHLPIYSQVSREECILHLSEHHSDCTPGSCIRIETSSLEEYSNYLKQKNYSNANPTIEIQPWGFKELSIVDPFGNNLIFCERQKTENN